jgi:hypothetical protein
MCNVKPLKVIKVENNRVVLENGINALFDTREYSLKKNDMVLVYANLVVKKIDNYE